MPRRSVLLAAAVALLVVLVAVFVLTRGGDEPEQATVADPLGEALSYVPASTSLVGVLDTDSGSEQGRALAKLVRELPAARFGAGQLEGLAREFGLDFDDDVQPQLGAPLVLSGGALPQGLDVSGFLREGGVAAIVTRDPGEARDALDRAREDGRLRDAGGGLLAARGGVLALDGPTLLLAGDAAGARRALDVHRRRAGLTRAVLVDRLGPLAGPALLRFAGQPQVLAAALGEDVPYLKALRTSALSVRLEAPGVRVRLHAPADPARVRAEDLPLAAGAQPPAPAAGSAPSAVGIRDLSRTLDWLAANRDAVRLPLLDPLLTLLDTIDRVRGPLKTFGRIDVDDALLDQLTGTTTLTREPRGGFALRAELRDGGPLRTALGRISRVPDVALDLAGAGDLDLDRSGEEAFTYRLDRRLLRLAVLGNVLVATDDTGAGLRALANRRPAPAGGQGALAARATGGAVQDLLIERLGLPGAARLFLGGIGDLEAHVRTERTGLDAQVTLTIAP